jgi:hypothetical protein
MDLILAYIDPGSGSLLVQALIAGLVAIPVFFRHQIARMIRAVRGRDDASAENASGPDDTSAPG